MKSSNPLFVGFISYTHPTKHNFNPVVTATERLISGWYEAFQKRLITVCFYGSSAASMACRKMSGTGIPNLFSDTPNISRVCDHLVFVGPGMDDHFMQSFKVPFEHVRVELAEHPLDVIDKPMKPPGIR